MKIKINYLNLVNYLKVVVVLLKNQSGLKLLVDSIGLKISGEAGWKPKKHKAE